MGEGCNCETTYWQGKREPDIINNFISVNGARGRQQVKYVYDSITRAFSGRQRRLKLPPCDLLQRSFRLVFSASSPSSSLPSVSSVVERPFCGPPLPRPPVRATSTRSISTPHSSRATYVLPMGRPALTTTSSVRVAALSRHRDQLMRGSLTAPKRSGTMISALQLATIGFIGILA